MRQSAPGYEHTSAYHALYLPANWQPGKKFPVLVEYAGNGGYSKYRFVASFVGMVPAARPRFVVLVEVDEPRGAIWGGVVAAPAFQQIAKFDLQYMAVPPDAARTALSAG